MENNMYPENQRSHTWVNNDIRQKLINHFIKNNCGKFDEIMNAIGAGDVNLARRLAHNLKSDAGQLEMDALQKAAEAVEHQLNNGMNLVTPEQAAALKTGLDAAVQELTPLFHKPVRFAQAEPPSREAALELLKKIEPMLEDYNTECMSYIDSLRLIPGSETLIRQIEDFAFDAAYETNQKLMSEFDCFNML